MKLDPLYLGLYSKGELEAEAEAGPGHISLLLKSEVPRSEVWSSAQAGSVVSLDTEMFPNLEFCLTGGMEMSSSRLRLMLSRGP